MKILLTDPSWFEDPEEFESLEEIHQVMQENYDLTGDDVYIKAQFFIEDEKLYVFFPYEPPRYSGEPKEVGHVVCDDKS